MQRLYLIGTSHQLCDPSKLARLPARERLESLIEDSCQLGIWNGAVLVATCNRIEFYLDLEGSEDPRLDSLRALFGELPFYEHEGREAARHLFRVAGSLDSMVLGENQILGQVRRAWERARESETCTSLLDGLFQEALSAAKEIRNTTGLGTQCVSVASIGCHELLDALSPLAGRKPRIALLGAGTMVRKAVVTLGDICEAELLFVNRTASKARALAEEHDGRSMPLESFLAFPPVLDAILVAVRGDEPVLRREFLERLPLPDTRRIVLLDLGVPSCVDPELGDDPRVLRIDMDHLQARSRRHAEERREAARRAEPIAARHVLAFARRLSARRLGLERVRARHIEMAEQEFEALVRKDLAFLPEEERERLKRRFLRLAKAHAHLHLKDLKVLASET